jgi:hypothetical protein
MSSKTVEITSECVINGNITLVGTVVEVDEVTSVELLNNNRAVVIEEE